MSKNKIYFFPKSDTNFDESQKKKFRILTQSMNNVKNSVLSKVLSNKKSVHVLTFDAIST